MSKVGRRKASIREFGTREIRYADYRHGVVGEVAMRFLSNLAQKKHRILSRIYVKLCTDSNDRLGVK